ncbi:MAG: hypothetical protein IJ634_06660 [Bacteroidales bacterium]|nr:hypothetical protein [Bacteroidales bacterium]
MRKVKQYLGCCVADPYLLLGHVCMILLLVLSVVYANVRVLLTDSAYQVFYDLNHPGILINDSRYSMVLTQILPWLAIHLHAPLWLVVVSYSASFILVGYACWLVTAYAMGQRKAATLMLFVLLGIGGTFLHCISESFQLMFYAPMLYGWMCVGGEKLGMKSGKWKVGYYLILALLVALAFFIYPMAVFYILFAVGFRLLEGGKPHIDVPALATAALLMAYIVLYWIIGPSGHDSEFVPTWDVVLHSLRHFASLGSFTTFLILFARIYFVPTVLLVLTLIGYARGRQWWKFAFLAGYTLCFFVSSCIIYQTGDSRISRERYFIPLFFIVGLAFLVDELPRFSQRQRQWWFCIFVALIVFAFGRIMHYVHSYELRLEAIAEVTQMAERQGQHKLLVTRSTAEEAFPLDIWGLALESMLFTAQQGPEHTVTIYKEEDDFDRTNADLYDNPEVYVSVNWWKRWEVKDLNPYYFRLPAQGYKELVKTEEGYALVAL